MKTPWYAKPSMLVCPKCGHTYEKTEATMVHRCPTCQHVFVEPGSESYPEPIYAIGSLNRGDGAESPAPWPKTGRICPICHQAESDGAMFTTIGAVCDDCA